MTRALPLFALLLTSCGVSAEKFCNKAAKCAEDADVEVSDEDLDFCIEIYEEAEKIYDEAGCSKEYKKILKCSMKNAECDSDGYLEIDYDACEDEQKAAEDCLGTT